MFCLPSFLPSSWSPKPSFLAKVYMIDWSERDSNRGSITFSRPRLAVRRVAPEDHAANVRILIDVLVLFEHAVDPARHRDAGLDHHRGRGELILQPLEIDVPHLRPVRPRARRETVVARQRI